MKRGWSEIISIWVGVAIATLVVIFLDPKHSLVWVGAILAGSLAVVSLIHLFKEDVDGFVRSVQLPDQARLIGGRTLRQPGHRGDQHRLHRHERG